MHYNIFQIIALIIIGWAALHAIFFALLDLLTTAFHGVITLVNKLNNNKQNKHANSSKTPQP